MDDKFEKAIKFTLKWEGGYSNDPNDPGGETNYGISKRSYPNEDIKNMTPERARKIYYENYWLRAGCDKLSEPWDLMVLDAAVHHGVSRARDFYSRSTDWKDFLLLRIDFMTKCKKANLYMWGWSRRVANLYNTIRKEQVIEK